MLFLTKLDFMVDLSNEGGLLPTSTTSTGARFLWKR